VKIGYSRPKSTRGRHPSGLTEVIVWRPKDLQVVDPKTQAARIAHTVGENKRVQIIEEAKKANIRILNPGLKKPAEAVPEVEVGPTTETVTEAPTETTTKSDRALKEEEELQEEKESKPLGDEKAMKPEATKSAKKRSGKE
jgi:hypothetical protein